MQVEYIRGKPVDKERLAKYLEMAKGERTMKQFAEACGVNPSTLSRIANKRFLGASSETLIRAIFNNAIPNAGFTLEELMDANGMVPADSLRRDGFATRDGSFMRSGRINERDMASKIIINELSRRVPTSVGLLDQLRLSKSLGYRPSILCKSREFSGNGLWAFDILSGATVDGIMQRNRGEDTDTQRIVSRRRMINRRMFFERFARYVAAAYFNAEIAPMRISFVVFDPEVFYDIFEEFCEQKFQGYVSLILVDLHERKVSEEFVFPQQSGEIENAFFTKSLPAEEEENLSDLVDIDEIPF